MRSAAVTGAGSGLGRDIALGLAGKRYRGFVAIDLGHFEAGLRLQQFPGGPLAGINVVQVL
jgi:NAD(P)-dependent dehydrogenase (short-subunit alcohol dehydrogenase family)